MDVEKKCKTNEESIGHLVIVHGIQKLHCDPPKTSTPNTYPPPLQAVSSNGQCLSSVDRSTPLQPLESRFDWPTKGPLSTTCNLLLKHLENIPESRFQNPDNFEYCLGCTEFREQCEMDHDGHAAQLKKAWCERYAEKMKGKKMEVTKSRLLSQIKNLMNLYLDEETYG